MRPTSPQIHQVLADLVMVRGELEELDAKSKSWQGAQALRQQRQTRQDIEDALQERLADLGALLLDALLSTQEQDLLRSARQSLNLLFALNGQDSATSIDGELVEATPTLAAAKTAQTMETAPSKVVDTLKLCEAAPAAIVALEKHEPAMLQANAHVTEETPPPKARPVERPAQASSPAASRPNTQPTPVAVKQETKPQQALVDKPTTQKNAKSKSSPPQPKQPTPTPQKKPATSKAKILGKQEDLGALLREHSYNLFDDIIAQLGQSPTAFRTKGNVRDELKCLESAMSDEAMDQWRRLKGDEQLNLCCWTAARLRAVDDALKTKFTNRTEDQALCKKLIQRLTKYRSTHALAFVHGLAQAHNPSYGHTWIEQAQHYERQLRQDAEPRFWTSSPTPKLSGTAKVMAKIKARADYNLDDKLRALFELERHGELTEQILLAAVAEMQSHKIKLHNETRAINLCKPYLKELHASKAPKNFLRAITFALKRDQDSAERDSPDQNLSERWPWFEHTSNMNAVLIGGNRKPHRIKPIQDAFNFETLEWFDSNPREAQKLVERVKTGSVDMVIILRNFCPHRVSDPLFKLRKSLNYKLAQADTYGIESIRMGIERYLEEHVAK